MPLFPNIASFAKVSRGSARLNPIEDREEWAQRELLSHSPVFSWIGAGAT